MPAPVVILCPDLSNNALGRALVLAEVCKAIQPVKIVGWQSKAEVWPPGENAAIPIVVLSGGEGRPSRRQMHRQLGIELVAALQGHRLIVSKACTTSLGLVHELGLQASEYWLDLDDYELSFTLARARRRPSLWCSPPYLASLARRYRCERLARKHGAIQAPLTVANRWLQERYGGELLYHLRDPNTLQFNAADVEQQRQLSGLGTRRWVGFVGTIRAHKGVTDLVAAVAGISARDVNAELAPGVLLAGVDEHEPVARALLTRMRSMIEPERLRITPMFPSEQLPHVLSMPDIIVIPSRQGSSSAGQTPAKLFDALFMGKATVGAAVADIPTILDGAGVVFPPGDVPQLRACLVELLVDEKKRRRLEQQARSKALRCYTVDAARARAARYVEQLPVLSFPR